MRITLEESSKIVNLIPDLVKTTVNENVIQNYLRLFLSIIFLIFSLLVNCLGITYTNYLFGLDTPNHNPPLHDILIDHIPAPESTFIYAEFYIIIITCFAILIILLHVKRLIVIRRFLVCISSIFFLRGLFLFTTQLTIPHSITICPDYKNMPPSQIFQKAANYVIFFGLTRNGYGSCGDLIFSGHAAVVVMCTLFITYYTNFHIYKILIIWILSSVCCIFIVISRGHYTLDVLIGFFVSLIIFITYHTFIKIETARRILHSHESARIILSSIRHLIVISNFTTFIFERDSTDFENRFVKVIDKLKRLLNL